MADTLKVSAFFMASILKETTILSSDYKSQFSQFIKQILKKAHKQRDFMGFTP